MKKNMICGLLLLIILVATFAQSSSETARPVEDYKWVGPTGDPLPFENFQDAEEFLMASAVIRSKTRRKGVNKYKKVVLDKDGVWANSIFRWENEYLPTPEKVSQCSRSLYNALKQMDEDVVKETLASLLSEAELDAFFVRRKRLIRLLEDRVAEVGESQVFYD